MAVLPQDLGYEWKQKIITLREKGSIRIPDSVIQEAFAMEVSIEISSTKGNDYFNDKVLPSEFLYGYATLVFFDYVKKIVPLKFGRTTLYFERNEATYTNWEMFKWYHVTKYDFYRLTQVIGQFASQFGFTVTDTPYPSPPWKGFVELPLREVYIKCPEGTQFKIEVSWHVGKAFFPMDEPPITPKSQQPKRPKKDDGLPPTGITPPNNGKPSAPYERFPNPTGIEEQGLFWNPKTSSINDPNPDNAPAPNYPTDSSLNWYLQYRTQGTPALTELFVVNAVGMLYEVVSIEGTTYTYTENGTTRSAGVDGTFIYFARFYLR